MTWNIITMTIATCHEPGSIELWVCSSNHTGDHYLPGASGLVWKNGQREENKRQELAPTPALVLIGPPAWIEHQGGHFRPRQVTYT